MSDVSSPSEAEQTSQSGNLRTAASPPIPTIPTNSDGASVTARTCRIKGSVPMTTRCAACNCGKLEIVCEGEPVWISMCPCLECQRRTGAVLGGQAWFTQQQTTISGNSTQFTRRSDAGRSAPFRYCVLGSAGSSRPRCCSRGVICCSRVPGTHVLWMGSETASLG
jgi:hypothetical protein